MKTEINQRERLGAKGINSIFKPSCFFSALIISASPSDQKPPGIYSFVKQLEESGAQC